MLNLPIELLVHSDFASFTVFWAECKYLNSICYNIESNMISPKSQSVRLGTSATIECKLNSKLTWTFNSKIIPGDETPSNVNVVKNKLKIDLVAEFNEGLYECSGEIEKKYMWGGAIPFAAKSLLLIQGEMSNNIIYECCGLFIVWGVTRVTSLRSLGLSPWVVTRVTIIGSLGSPLRDCFIL